MYRESKGTWILASCTSHRFFQIQPWTSAFHVHTSWLIFQVKKYVTLKKCNKDSVLIYALKPPPKLKSGVRAMPAVCPVTWHCITIATTLSPKHSLMSWCAICFHLIKSCVYKDVVVCHSKLQVLDDFSVKLICLSCFCLTQDWNGQFECTANVLV